MPDWKKIKAEYIRGGTSYRKLADKYGVSSSTLRKVASKENWTDLRNKVGTKRDTKIVDSTASRQAKQVDIADTIADMLLTRIATEIEDGTLKLTAKGYNDISSAVRTLRDMVGKKNELDLQEQMARIEKLRKECKEEETSKEIKVSITGDLEAYSQ